jgi:oligopeptide/dipeptide ABC transporter ATP-binding protein
VSADVVVRAEGVSKSFRAGRGLGAPRAELRAVADVDLDVRRGEILAIVGESGSGKTTLGRCLLGLSRPSAGRIVFREQNLSLLRGDALKSFRRRVQPVFQNPYSSLDPRWSVERTVREGLDAFRIGSPAERRERVARVLEDVGLTERHGRSRPHELSGGQRQRVAIAAALATAPELIVADEPVSALDVLVQAQILNLISRLQREHRLTNVLITHDFGVVEHLADRVAVMYLGRIVEVGPTEDVLAEPAHPYTRALIDSIPVAAAGPAREAPKLRGEIPSPLDPPTGCAFHPRCPLAFERCPQERPRLEPVSANRHAACHLVNLGHD